MSKIKEFFKVIPKVLKDMGKGQKPLDSFIENSDNPKFAKGMRESGDFMKGIKKGGLNPLNKIMGLMQKVGIAKPFMSVMDGWMGFMTVGAVSSYAFQDALRDLTSTLSDAEFRKWLGETGNMFASITGPIMKAVGGMMKIMIAGVGQAWRWIKDSNMDIQKWSKLGVHTAKQQKYWFEQQEMIAAKRLAIDERAEGGEKQKIDALEKEQNFQDSLIDIVEVQTMPTTTTTSNLQEYYHPGGLPGEPTTTTNTTMDVNITGIVNQDIIDEITRSLSTMMWF